MVPNLGGDRWLEVANEDLNSEEAKKAKRRPGQVSEPCDVININSWFGDCGKLWLGDGKKTTLRPWKERRRDLVWSEDPATLPKQILRRRKKATRERIRRQFQDELPPPGVPNNWQDLVAEASLTTVSSREELFSRHDATCLGVATGQPKVGGDRGTGVGCISSTATCSAALLLEHVAKASEDRRVKPESSKASVRSQYGMYIPRAAAVDPCSLPEVCPSLPLQMAIGTRIVTIVTTAALPWFTGTAINPLLRAAYLALNHKVLVTLMVPWLEEEDQKQVYPKGVVFTNRREQEEHMRQWLWDRVKLPVLFRVAFYPAVFDLLKFGIFPTQKIDVTELIPPRERDVVILEEPEHLSWFNYQGKWRSKFRLSIGVGHTNYMDYLRRQAGEVFPPVVPLMWLVNVGLVRANCHKVIRLSRGVQWFCDSVVCNVHGVSPNFLDIGDRVRERALALLEDGFSSEDEVSSARIQPQADRDRPAAGDSICAGNRLWERMGGALQVDSCIPFDGNAGFVGSRDDLDSAVGSRDFELSRGGRRGSDSPMTPSSSSDSLRTPTSVLQGRVFADRLGNRGGSLELPGSRSQFSGGCYFIGRAIWGKGYHELSQLLRQQKWALEEQESAFSATGQGVSGAAWSPKHRVVQLEDLDGQALRPGKDKISPEGGALPLVQERGGGSTFRLLSLCMHSRFLWHLQTMWLRRRYGTRLKWLEHGRRAFCALQGGGGKVLPRIEPPVTESVQVGSVEKAHSAGAGERVSQRGNSLEMVPGQVWSVQPIGSGSLRKAGSEVEGCCRSGGPKGGEFCASDEAAEICSGRNSAHGGGRIGDSAGARSGGKLAELVHVDCYGTGPHEGEIEAFAKEHGLPLSFHGRIDHKELVQYKVYVNPAISDVVCTATAEALAMGKFAVIANHPSNEFFKDNFAGNCITFRSDDPDDFLRCLHFALEHEPAPLTAGQRRLLTWEAATERFLQAAGL